MMYCIHSTDFYSKTSMKHYTEFELQDEEVNARKREMQMI